FSILNFDLSEHGSFRSRFSIKIQNSQIKISPLRPLHRKVQQEDPMEPGIKRAAYKEILYEVKNGVAWVAINRPEVRNAFREQTLDELIDALKSTRNDPSIACAV